MNAASNSTNSNLEILIRNKLENNRIPPENRDSYNLLIARVTDFLPAIANANAELEERICMEKNPEESIVEVIDYNKSDSDDRSSGLQSFEAFAPLHVEFV